MCAVYWVCIVSLWTVVVAAGEGLRFGSDKQSADLGGVPVLTRSVVTASAVSDGVVVVVAENRIEGVRTLLADLDGDGDIGVNDLLSLLNSWGTGAGDIQGDGRTDIDDILLILGGWGNCP